MENGVIIYRICRRILIGTPRVWPRNLIIMFFFLSQDIIKLMIVKNTVKQAKRQRQNLWKETDGANIRGLIEFLISPGASKQSKVNLITV